MAHHGKFRSFGDWILDIMEKDDEETLGQKGFVPSISIFARFNEESMNTLSDLNANRPVSIYRMKKMLKQTRTPFDPHDKADIVLKAKQLQRGKTKSTPYPEPAAARWIDYLNNELKYRVNPLPVDEELYGVLKSLK